MNTEQNKKENLTEPRCSSENWKENVSVEVCLEIRSPEIFVALFFNKRDGDQVPNRV
jgi:hypothetical protein